MRRYSWGTILYIIIGIIVASNRGYLVGLGSLANIISAILAVLLWPLLPLGINLRLTF